MPNVTFDKGYLHKLIGFEIDEKKLEAAIMKMGLSVEEETKDSITVEIDANRPDLLDHVGFARAVKNFEHRSKKLDYNVAGESGIELGVGKDVATVRPHISAMVVRGLSLSDESLRHLIGFTEKFCETFGRNRRKIAIGLHDLAKVKPPLYYNAFPDESFLPLDCKRAMRFSEILKETEKGSAYAYTIADSKRYPALKDAEGVIAFIPILNSERTKVTKSTKELFVDITGTQRYNVEKSADLLASMFIDMGAKVYRVKVTYANGKSALLPGMEARKIKIALKDAELQIGVVVGFNNIISLANKMGYKAALVNKQVLFYVPPYRLDILNDQDIVEDIAIAYGYDYIQPVPIYSASVGSVDTVTLTTRKIACIMLGMGFSEEANSYLTNENVNFGLMRLAPEKSYVRIKNAKAGSISMLRTSLLPMLLRDLGQSVHEKMPQKIYEFDMAFKMDNGKVAEHYNLGAVVADPNNNFNYIKGVAEAVLYEMFGKDYKIEEYSHSSFIEGRCAKAIVRGKEIGFFGEFHPEAISNFGIEEPTFGLEFAIL